MPLLTATNISLSFGSRTILDEVSISIEPGERVGVVGRNGTGKTTLLRILAGDLAPDEGQVVLRKGSRVGVLHQDPHFEPGQTLKEAAEEGFAELHDLHRQLHELFERMDGAGNEELVRLLARQAELERRVETAGGYAIDHKIGEVLHGLGFTDNQFALGVDKLSGGQRARLALARLLLENPDIILLDEPTNHLDLEGRLWLESFLIDEFRGAVLMIAHDRYLLDRVASRIIEVERTGLIDYPGNYTKFRQLRLDRRVGMMRAWEKEQTRFRREAAFIRKYKAGQRAKQAKGRESRLDRERASSTLERPLELTNLNLSLPKAERTGDIVVACRGLSKAYEAQDGSIRVLFKDLDLQIERGQRWGIVGPNGAGKTTLVRTMLGEVQQDAGSIKLGTRLAVGYYRQTHEFLDDELTVVRQIQRLVARQNPDRLLTEQETRNLAGAFLFSGGEQDKEIGVLSGGERSRVVLASLMASARNLLVLDEPTNHLDIPSAERLEQLLRTPEQGGAYDGTLLLISHDRALIDATCDHLLILDGLGGARVYFGNYSQWREHEESASSGASTSTPRSPTQDSAPAVKPKAPASKKRPKNRFSWMPLDQLEERIGELETQAAALDEALGDAATWTDPQKGKDLTIERDAIRAELGELEDEWLHKSEAR